MDVVECCGPRSTSSKTAPESTRQIARVDNTNMNNPREESEHANLIQSPPSHACRREGDECGGYWEDVDGEPIAFDEDVYSLVISDLAHDFERLGLGNAAAGVQISRILASIILLFGCISIQVFLLAEIKKFVTAKAVHDIRRAYAAFELGMHGNDPLHCDMTDNGFCRGKPEFFDASLFDGLDGDVQAAACRIPLSQPVFFGIILWLWTTTCLGQFMKLYRQFMCVIVRTTTTTNSHAVYQNPQPDDISDEPLPPDEKTKIIYQLTCRVKALFTIVVFVPRLLIIFDLLWLGCRWLLATNNFGDLILNAVALEFILLLGEMLYVAMAPERNKSDLGRFQMLPLRKKHAVGYEQLLYILSFNAATMSWVGIYMVYFQMVLPDYRWDVHEVCKAWLAQRFSV